MNCRMEDVFAERAKKIKLTATREIMKNTEAKDIISFAGGLPASEVFPIDELASAADKVLRVDGTSALQYTISEGIFPLREYVAEMVKEKYGIPAKPENILITNGSQQALMLLGMMFFDQGDKVVMEDPTYLAAIQAFEICNPQFIAVTLEDDGIDLEKLGHVLKNNKVKALYAVTSFHNPTGVYYSLEKREGLARLLEKYNVLLIEDNPYNEIRFAGDERPPVCQLYQGRKIMLGTFSKILSPGLRMGWVCSDEEIINKLNAFKGSADLCSNNLSQRIICQFLKDNDISKHIEKIRQVYRSRCFCMVDAIDDFFKCEKHYVRPDGGMFIWLTLPGNISTTEVFHEALRKGVAFVPGEAFYCTEKKYNSMRLNFTHASEEKIRHGIELLAEVFECYQ